MSCQEQYPRKDFFSKENILISQRDFLLAFEVSYAKYSRVFLNETFAVKGSYGFTNFISLSGKIEAGQNYFHLPATSLLVLPFFSILNPASAEALAFSMIEGADINYRFSKNIGFSIYLYPAGLTFMNPEPDHLNVLTGQPFEENPNLYFTAKAGTYLHLIFKNLFLSAFMEFEQPYRNTNGIFSNGASMGYKF